MTSSQDCVDPKLRSLSSEPESAYRALFAQIASGIAIYEAVDDGRDFVFLDFNPAAERIDQIPRADVIGRRLSEVFPAIREFGLLDVLERVWRTGESEHHPVRLYRDGRIEGWRDNQVFRLPGGSVVAVYEDKTAERETDDRFRQLATAVRDVFWLQSPDWTKIHYVSPAFEEVWGQSRQSLYDDPQSWFEAIHPDDRKAVSRAFKHTPTSGLSDPRLPPFRVIRPDEEIRWVEARRFAIRNDQGKVVRVAGVAEDVTERHLAEEELRRSEVRFRATFEQSAVGMAHIGLDGRFLRLNDRLCSTTGYSRNELQALTFQDITHPDDLNSDLQLADQLWDGKIPSYTIEKRYIRKSGEAVWIALTASVVRDEQGRPEYGIAVVENISSRKAAEALRASEELQRMALAAAEAGAWEYEGSTGTQIWTPETFDIYGIDRSQKAPVFDDWLSRCVHPDDQDRLKAVLNQAIDAGGGAFRLEFRSPHPWKGLRWLMWLGRVVSDSEYNIVRAYGINLDITERRQNEEALRVSEERLRLAMAAGRIGVWDWDLASARVSWSENLCERMHMAPDKFEGTLEAFQRLVHPDDRILVAEALDQALAGKAEYKAEFRMRSPDGVERWTDTHATVIRDSAGQPARMIGVDVDITASKAAESHQKFLASELNHRIKNLLATIQSTMNLTLRSSPTKEAFAEAFSARLQALKRGNDMLVRSGWHLVRLSELVHGALASFGGTHQINVRDPELKLAPESALALNMIFHELATNAAKYGALSVPDGKVQIDCQASADEAGVAVCRWTESGGPPVRPPDRKGFGTQVIERSARSSLRGSASLDYRPEGLECVIRFAAEQGSADRD